MPKYALTYYDVLLTQATENIGNHGNIININSFDSRQRNRMFEKYGSRHELEEKFGSYCFYASKPPAFYDIVPVIQKLHESSEIEYITNILKLPIHTKNKIFRVYYRLFGLKQFNATQLKEIWIILYREISPPYCKLVHHVKFSNMFTSISKFFEEYLVWLKSHPKTEDGPFDLLAYTEDEITLIEHQEIEDNTTEDLSEDDSDSNEFYSDKEE